MSPKAAGKGKGAGGGKGVEEGVQIVCRNRRAKERFRVERTFEAGLVLVGTEVKSLRAGLADLSDAYGMVRDGEAFLHGFHIAPYTHRGYVNHDPKRTRRLLLHRREIARLTGRVQERGYTLVPLVVYFRQGWAKVEMALATGKSGTDRRQEIRKRDFDREIRRGARR